MKIFLILFFLTMSSNVMSSDNNLSGKKLLCKDSIKEEAFEFLSWIKVRRHTFLESSGKYYRDSVSYHYVTDRDTISIYNKISTWQKSVRISRITLKRGDGTQCELTEINLDNHFKSKEDKHFEGIEDKRKI